MKLGDIVLIVSDTEDEGARGVYRGDAEVAIGPRVSTYRIITFADGHDGAYEDRELQVVEDVRQEGGR